MKKNLLLGLVLALAVGAFWWGKSAQQGGGGTAANAGEAVNKMFAMNLQDSQGHLQAVSQWRGKTLVVNFWATWCPPCREEMPMFSRVAARLAEKNVQFLGFGIDDAEKIRQFASKNPVSYPLLQGGAELTELSRDFGNNRLALPFTVVLNPGGRVVATKLGGISEEELLRLIASALD